MDKFHLTKPYTFRSRMMVALLVSSLMATLVSLMLSYVISHANLLEELRLKQQATAIFILEADQRTDLPLEDIMQMVEQEELDIGHLSAADIHALPPDVQSAMDNYKIFTTSSSSPITYVQLNDGVMSISAAKGDNLYLAAFVRIVFASCSFMAVFALMVTLATYRISKPIHALTSATRRLEEGDFTVRLPEKTPGEVGELVCSFNKMTEALGRTAYLQKDFISSVSHEFKTPIASIRGFAQLLQMPGLTEEQRSEYVDLIARESDRLSRLSETLLRLTALEQQTASATLSEFSLDEQIRQVILRLEPAWSAQDIGWQLDLDSVKIVSDEALLGHVWVNLIQNAIKFSPEGATIEVRVMMAENAVVEITDHGIGMDEETLTRIFERFYQADKSHSQEGVGLGLCLVKRILDMLGGTVSVRSKPQEGSTFRVLVPSRNMEERKP